jgi:hypothetical protein
MNRLTSVALLLFFCFSLMIATARPAFGYVDPGSGLLALQSAASVVAASVYFLRRRIRALFVRPTDAANQNISAKDTTPAKAA